MKSNTLKSITLLAIIICLFTTSKALCQNNDTLLQLNRIHTDLITLPAPATSTNIALKNIEVEDMRYDTSFVGFNKLNAIILGPNAAAEIAKHINAAFVFDNTGPNAVVLYIKTFWLGNQLSVYSEVAGPNKGKWKQGLVCKMECFYKQEDNYYALFRYDTTLLAKEKLEDEAVDLITTCLKRVSQKITGSVASFHTGKTKMNAAEISKYYLNRFNMPALKDEVLQRGVYKTFAEFQKNRPSLKNYAIENDKIADLLYVIDSAGNHSLVRDMWGYCDGKRAFVKSVDNYFPLEKVGNSFYLKAFKDVEIWHTDDYNRPVSIENQTTGERKYNLGPGRGTKVKRKVFYKPYQLNMETGEIY